MPERLAFRAQGQVCIWIKSGYSRNIGSASLTPRSLKIFEISSAFFSASPRDQVRLLISRKQPSTGGSKMRSMLMKNSRPW